MAAELTDPTTMVALASVVGVVLSSWFSLRKLATRERHRTDRFTEAIRDATPRERPEIIRALHGLEDNEATHVEPPSEPNPTMSAHQVALATVQRILRKVGPERGK